jgi:hypothetical protein
LVGDSVSEKVFVGINVLVGVTDSVLDALSLTEDVADALVENVSVGLFVNDSVDVFEGVGISVLVGVKDSVCDKVVVEEIETDDVIDGEDESDAVAVSLEVRDFVFVSVSDLLFVRRRVNDRKVFVFVLDLV